MFPITFTVWQWLSLSICSTIVMVCFGAVVAVFAAMYRKHVLETAVHIVKKVVPGKLWEKHFTTEEEFLNNVLEETEGL